MNLYRTLIAAIIALVAIVPAGGSEWRSNYGKALTAAKSAGRPLLVVLDIPGGVETRFTHARLDIDDDTETALLDLYELCRVDVSTEYGKKVAKAFGVTSFPHTVITDRAIKNIIFRKSGGFTDQEWVSTLLSYQNGSPPPPFVCPNCPR